MGLGAIDYAINNPHKRPKLVVVTDIDEDRLNRAQRLLLLKMLLRMVLSLFISISRSLLIGHTFDVHYQWKDIMMCLFLHL